MLMKRTEQVKKLETKISELAALIKDKNRSIDKLEKNLEKQQDGKGILINVLCKILSACQLYFPTRTYVILCLVGICSACYWRVINEFILRCLHPQIVNKLFESR